MKDRTFMGKGHRHSKLFNSELDEYDDEIDEDPEKLDEEPEEDI
ncbi:MAG: hypothetical protein ACE5ES_05380 [Candidatus Nanoarchaeia archaeon]